MKRHAEQSLLAAGFYILGDIEKRTRKSASVLYDLNAALLFYDEESRIAWRRSEIDRAPKLTNSLEPDCSLSGSLRI
jgi:hypothetical protein